DRAYARLRSPGSIWRRRCPFPNACTRAAGASGRADPLAEVGPQRSSRRSRSVTAGARLDRAQAVVDLEVLRFELEAGRACLQLQQRCEIDVVPAEREHPLDDLLRNRGERHRNLELASRRKPEMEVLQQELRGEGRLEIEVDVG